ncbi:MAG: lamin tail domain-containing protein, partial [Candidatus Marinimicrobia bacterium]|nr:lamin tail domain-containing protein [Candidatus Neomarinimicrobiota bacterium]
MKKFVTFFVLVLATSVAFGQVADLFFSEYIEGGSSNKAIEIYNGTGTAIDLANYQIAQSVNGGGWQYFHTFPTGATIADGDVWVIINKDVSATLYDTLNADEVLAYPSVVHHNGDDARAMIKIVGTDTTWLDIIGDPNTDPGDGWDVAGVTNATKDHSLVRKDNVFFGNTNWTASAGTHADTSEWIVLAKDVLDSLGAHKQLPFNNVTFTITDSTMSYQKIMIKGGMTGWGTVQCYDDGANGGDVTANDHIWTVTVVVDTGTYEWGAIEDDGSEWGIWLIDGANRVFTVA